MSQNKYDFKYFLMVKIKRQKLKKIYSDNKNTYLNRDAVKFISFDELFETYDKGLERLKKLTK